METPEMQVLEWKVDGMTCSNCAMGVQRRLEKQGMKEVNVNFATGDVRFENNAALPIDVIKESIEELGYQVTLPQAGEGQKKND